MTVNNSFLFFVPGNNKASPIHLLPLMCDPIQDNFPVDKLQGGQYSIRNCFVLTTDKSQC